MGTSRAEPSCSNCSVLELSGRIAVQGDRIHFFRQTADRLINQSRCGNARIADAEIKDLVGADLSLPFFAVFEQLADGRAVFSQEHHFFCDNNFIQQKSRNAFASPARRIADENLEKPRSGVFRKRIVRIRKVIISVSPNPGHLAPS